MLRERETESRRAQQVADRVSNPEPRLFLSLLSLRRGGIHKPSSCSHNDVRGEVKKISIWLPCLSERVKAGNGGSGGNRSTEKTGD